MRERTYGSFWRSWTVSLAAALVWSAALLVGCAGASDGDGPGADTGPAADTGSGTDGGGGADASLSDAGGGAGRLVVNEVVATALDGGPDWVELFNGGDAAVDISGWALRDEDDAHEYFFPDGSSLPPGGYLVVEAAVVEGGEGFPFGLGGADAVRLFDTEGVLVDQTAWVEGAAPAGRSWGRYPNGTGPFATLSAPTQGALNAEPGGGEDVIGPPEDVVTPPADVPTPPDDVPGPPGDVPTPPTDVDAPIYTVVVNEVLARPVLTSADVDWIELHNRANDPVDISGWILRDADDLHEFLIPDGTEIAGRGYVVFSRDESGAGQGFDFGLGPADTVRLFDAGGAPVDQTAWIDGQAPEGLTWGRYPDGVGPFATLSTPTAGLTNAAPLQR